MINPEDLTKLGELGYVVQFGLDTNLEHEHRYHVQLINWERGGPYLAAADSWGEALTKALIWALD